MRIQSHVCQISSTPEPHQTDRQTVIPYLPTFPSRVLLYSHVIHCPFSRLEFVHGMNETSPHLLLRAPIPTQLRLSFCEATPRDLKRWIANLPKANIGETARQLYQGLSELNQLLTPSDNRLQLLELLRPEVYYVCKHLERHFLHQSIVLDERSRKIANLCQALQSHLAIGYKQIVVRVTPRFSKDRAPLLAQALQRAIHCLNGPLIRATELYCPVPEGAVAGVASAVPDRLCASAPAPEPARRTGQPDANAEHRTDLRRRLAAGRRTLQSTAPEPDRPARRSAGALEQTGSSCNPANPADGLFAVAPDSTSGRVTARNSARAAESVCSGFDPQPLVRTPLKRICKKPTALTPLPVPAGLSLDTLQHLHAAWGQAAERGFQRTASQGTLTLCVGMSALHFYLGGATLVQRHPETSRAPGRRNSRRLPLPPE